ncbi:DUF6132 family protein [uncultured Draconibacterium sp.]|jgi:hypothetical protein|uniref:DUF6132 family protein n=1 Tax=uncultured Draconibacterium sp. TaxID=1573823 RepID=UPI0025D3DA45|nr:DUF6132 family protein [uncultured Draconibacterium sp.]
MKFIKQKQIALILLVIGAIGGFLYWKYVGCLSGTCKIKSVWYWSTLWGAAIGYLVGDTINDIVLKIKSRKQQNDREI